MHIIVKFLLKGWLSFCVFTTIFETKISNELRGDYLMGCRYMRTNTQCSHSYKKLKKWIMRSNRVKQWYQRLRWRGRRKAGDRMFTSVRVQKRNPNFQYSMRG